MIESQSGWISSRIDLDHEKKSKYRLVVRAQNPNSSGSLGSWTDVIVTVHVIDDNDNVPRFDHKEYHFG